MRTDVRWLRGLLASSLFLVMACATTTDTVPVSRAPASDRMFLLPPLDGYPLRVDPGDAGRITAAYEALVNSADVELASSTATGLLDQNDALHPALVLLAQAELVQGAPLEAARRLTPIVAEFPEYTAAQLTLGRAAETSDDPVRAYESFRRIAEMNETAGRRARALRPRAIQVVHNRFEDDLQRGRLQDALGELDQLTQWAPEDEQTLRATMSVAAILEDPERELVALRALTARSNADEDLMRRRAELEIEVGDAGAGVQIFEDLVAQNPNDPQSIDDLAAAKFRWRLQVLPREVSKVARRAELSRGEFAMLVYWLFPAIRFGSSTSAEIATDVLDHRHRDQIVRVVNLGLMPVNPVLHTFQPGLPVTRRDALSALVLLLGAEEPRPACIDVTGTTQHMSLQRICELSARCKLIDDAASCLPGATVSGSEALEFARKAQDQVESP